MLNYSGIKSHATEDLDIAELAKLVRQDLKAALAAGELPRGKYRVRISRYSMGQEMAISLADTGKSWCIAKACHAYQDRAPSAAYADGFTTEYHQVVEKLEAIANAYNYDKSDSQTDYFDCNFHLTVEIADARAERERIYAAHELAKTGRGLAVRVDIDEELQKLQAPASAEVEAEPPREHDWYSNLPEEV